MPYTASLEKGQNSKYSFHQSGQEEKPERALSSWGQGSAQA